MDQLENRRVYSENIDYSYELDSLNSISVYILQQDTISEILHL